jgi:hypothetical protein
MVVVVVVVAAGPDEGNFVVSAVNLWFWKNAKRQTRSTQATPDEQALPDTDRQ